MFGQIHGPAAGALRIGGAGFPLPERAAAAPRRAARVAPGGTALALSGITLAFGGVTALDGIDLEVAPGEIRAIIGPNGAGKSSLINVITGLYRPDRGRVTLGGRGFAQVPTRQLAALGVARTFQNLALFKGLSVRENVALGRISRHRAGFVEQVLGSQRSRRERADALARADQLLEFLHLGAEADRLVATLPYGTQKRVELARALVAEPRLLLLDEPMAGVSAAEKRDMAQYIRAARDRFGTSVVLIEHDIAVVMGLSDRVAVLDHGVKIADGTPSQVRADPKVIAAYLGAASPELVS